MPCLSLLSSNAILFFTASDFTSITSHIHNWALFSLWLLLFILSGIISPLFSSSILGTYRPEEFIFLYHIFWPFHTIHGVLKARTQSSLPFPSPLKHILSELSIMTHPSWVAIHGMAHSFTFSSSKKRKNTRKTTAAPAAAAAKSLQSCLTLCHPINGLLPGSSVPEILQARTLEWVAISFSNA